MPPITVYIKPTCPYCAMTRSLLKRKEVPFEEIDIARHPERREEMIERAGGRSTVPQVFIGKTHVGGNDELQALQQQGKLDALITAES